MKRMISSLFVALAIAALSAIAAPAEASSRRPPPVCPIDGPCRIPPPIAPN